MENQTIEEQIGTQANSSELCTQTTSNQLRSTHDKYISDYAVMEYLAINTGKLYHHKIRLASIVSKDNVTR